MVEVRDGDGWPGVRYAWCMRYGEGGGLTAAERARREQVRFPAADLMKAGAARPGGGAAVSGVADVGEPVAAGAGCWWPGGAGFKGAGGARCKLTRAQLDELAAVLEAGPAAQGWEDQCWTLARVTDVIWRRFGVEYTLAGADLLLHRIGWSVQFPARRAAERDRRGSSPGGRRCGRW